MENREKKMRLKLKRKMFKIKNPRNNQFFSGLICHTALLAEKVSAKVRQLDLAKSRVAECQQRVHDLIDLR